MAIRFTCSCGAKLSVKDELAGREGKCPACGTSMTVPAAAASPSPSLQEARPSVLPPKPARKSNPFDFNAPAIAGSAAREAESEEPLRLKETPPLRLPDPLALQVTHGTELAAAERAASAAPAALSARKAPPPNLFLKKAAPQSGFYEYRHSLLLLALLPLLFSLFSTEDNVIERVQRTLSHLTPETQGKIKALETQPDAKMNDLFALLPGQRIEGAHLSRGTWMHWIYAAMSAAAFIGLILVLFPQGNAETADLIKVGLLTGTIGIVFLLAVQWIAAWSAAIGIRVIGKLTIFIWVIQFIGFSYRCALDPSNGFLLSFLGFTCGVGLCEELCKGWPVMRHFVKKAKLDWQGACVWGLASGVGFGVSEGIMYSSDYYNGITGMDIYIIRFVSCVALHAIWGASVGIGMYRRQYSYQGGLSIYEMALPIILVISVPMIFHGLYDTLLKKDSPGWAFLVAFASFGFLIWQIEQMRREEKSDESPVPSLAG